MHRIYLVRRENKPVYVGYTRRSIEERWQEHIRNSNKPKFVLHHAIKKHGASAFSIETLYESEDKEHTHNYMEHHYIWLYKTHISEGGHNMTLGGDGGGKPKTKTTNMKEYQKAWYQANKDKMKAHNKAWYEENKEKRKARMKATHKAWYEANKDREKTRMKAWYEENKEKRKAQIS